MEIICPQCGFGREVAEDKVPAKSVFATCPKCRFKFRFRALEEPEYEFEAEEETAPEPIAPPAPPAPRAPERPAPARAEAAARPAPPAAPPVQPEPPLAPPAPPQPDNRPMRRIVLRDEYADEPSEPLPPQGETRGADRDQAGPARSGDIWQKLENLAREENSRAESDDGAGFPGGGRGSGSVPWEDLTHIGFFNGLWTTIKGALFKPSQFFRSLPAEGGLSKPTGFYVLLSMFAAAMQTVWFGVFFDTLNQRFHFPPEITQNVQFSLTQDLLGVAVLTPALALLKIGVGAAILHLALRTMNAASGGFAATYRVVAYTSATALFSLIPLLGMLADLLWWMVIFLIALKEAHRTSYGRVLLAIHLPVLVVILALVVAAKLPGGA